MTSLSHSLRPLPLLPPLLPLSPLDQSEHWIACPALSIERSCRIKAVSASAAARAAAAAAVDSEEGPAMPLFCTRHGAQTF